jgi:hypothetical protein
VHLLISQQEADDWSMQFPLPLPRVSFMLQDMIGDNSVLIDWADPPEVRDKIILQSRDNQCYLLLTCVALLQK